MFPVAATSSWRLQRVSTANGPLNPPPPLVARPSHIPAALTRVIGRDATIAALTAQLDRRRLLTIVGPGGIGKTTVAAAVAEAASGTFQDGVWFVGLAAVAKAELVPSALGGVLGISLPGANPIAGLIAWLRDRHALLVFDNCEHVIGAVAALAEEIVTSAPRVSILATSREPLRAAGESRHRLVPLDLPPDSSEVTVSDALQYSAVQLFNERASATTDDFVVEDGDVAAIIEICRRLDGVPLALELAAAHVGVIGVKALAARLDDRFAFLIKGRRTALPQHQTLRATLDWSHDLLPETEQLVLRRLGVFHGDFTMEAAAAIAVGEGLAPNDVVDGIANLADKSMVTADISGNVTYYHLLELTRAYALERLLQSGERDAVMRRHAEYYRDLFAHAEAGARARSRAEWIAGYGRLLGNLRAALGWAFSPSGDVGIGVALAASATDFWLAMSLLNECCDWGLQAVAQLGDAEGTRQEMMLQSGLGQALTFSRGMQSDAHAALTRALELAESLADYERQVDALYGLWLFALRVVDFRECLALAERCQVLAEATPGSVGNITAYWMLGQSQVLPGRTGHRCCQYPANARGIFDREARRRPAPLWRGPAVLLAVLPVGEPLVPGVGGSGHAGGQGGDRGSAEHQPFGFALHRAGRAQQHLPGEDGIPGGGGTLHRRAYRSLGEALADAVPRFRPVLEGCPPGGAW